MTVSAHQSPIMYKITSPNKQPGKRDRSVSRTVQRRGRNMNAFQVESKSRSKSQYSKKIKEAEVDDALNRSAMVVGDQQDVIENLESAVS